MNKVAKNLQTFKIILRPKLKPIKSTVSFIVTFVYDKYGKIKMSFIAIRLT